jgi:hypothetical protein
LYHKAPVSVRGEKSSEDREELGKSVAKE